MKDYISVPANSSADYIADDLAKPSADGRYLADNHICTLCKCKCTLGDCRSCNFPLFHALVMLRGR